jgi:hypothetical protein
MYLALSVWSSTPRALFPPHLYVKPQLWDLKPFPSGIANRARSLFESSTLSFYANNCMQLAKCSIRPPSLLTEMIKRANTYHQTVQINKAESMTLK